MINTLTDDLYWDELSKRLDPIFKIDPELKIFANLDPAYRVGHMMKLIGPHSDQALRLLFYLVEDEKNKGMKKEEFLLWVDFQLPEIKRRILRDAINILSKKEASKIVKRKKVNEMAKLIDEERNLEKCFLLLLEIYIL